MSKLTVRNIVILWLVWAAIIIGFQALATARLQPQWPDRAQEWTFNSTNKNGANYQKGHPYLLGPFMNNQVAFDSEYYLSISMKGYDDPCAPTLLPTSGMVIVPCTNKDSIPGTGNTPGTGGEKNPITLSYAFFPFYPFMIHLFSIPLGLLGMNPIAAATLAGVIVSALGTLLAMLALYDLTHETLGEEGGLRAVFYLLIFPTAFFLIQVYTEGLFAGLAFACLAMLKRKRLVYAALLGMAATLTRAVGIALIIPMAISWLRTNEWYALDMEWGQRRSGKVPWQALWSGLLAFAPAISFLVWKLSPLGFKFDFIEKLYFGRATIDLGYAVFAWATTFREMFQGFMGMNSPGGSLIPGLIPFINLQHSVYYFTEFFAILIAIIAILRCLKTDPEVAWFSLAVFIISFGSGSPQSMERYVLCAPAVYIGLARWGKNPVFDRVWTIISILLMGLLAMLYAFNFWVA